LIVLNTKKKTTTNLSKSILTTGYKIYAAGNTFVSLTLKENLNSNKKIHVSLAVK